MDVIKETMKMVKIAGHGIMSWDAAKMYGGHTYHGVARMMVDKMGE